jgi:hypothetical protein
VRARPWDIIISCGRSVRRQCASIASARHVIAITIPAETTSRPPKALAWRHLGQDNRDHESEVISVEIRAGREAFLPVIQAKPASLRNEGDPGV